MTDFKTIPGTKGRYEVSADGVVRRRCDFKVLMPQTIKRTIKGKRYIIVVLGVIMGDSKTATHRTPATLVASAWLGPKPSGSVLAFKDGNRFNIHASNLEYRPRVALRGGTHYAKKKEGGTDEVSDPNGR